jgi:hypothetical protein
MACKTFAPHAFWNFAVPTVQSLPRSKQRDGSRPQREDVMTARRQLLPLAVLASGAAAMFARIRHLNGGSFSYSMDDPYIHLALAQRWCRSSGGKRIERSFGG